jgi:phosphatidylcholine synthase
VITEERTRAGGDLLPVLRAWSVHLYTALGLVAGFFALRAIAGGEPHRAFVFLAFALWFDATDGPFARRWEVLRWTPHFNGRKLDDITDYLNYTFLPVFFAYRFGLVEGPAGTAVLAAVLLSSAYGFCSEGAKTEDHYFTGFPSYWNLLIFYLYLLDGPAWINALLLVLFAALVWVPVKYVTWRTDTLRRLTLAGSLLWAVLLLILLITFDRAPPWLLWGSLIYPLYHFGLSFYLYLSGKSR